MIVRGFVLQPTYRIVDGRPVVHLYGKLESGESFLVRDDRQVPSFYVRTADVDRAVSLGVERIAESEMTTFDGHEAARVDLRIPSDTPPVRDRIAAHGIATYEADVRFARRFLLDRGVRGSLEIAGEGRREPGLGRVFDNPEVRPADWTPRLDLLSVDIETDPKARRLLSVGLYGCGAAEVLIFQPSAKYPTPADAVAFPSERDLLAGFCERVRQLDPDVLTGWNVVDFDFRVLDRLAGRFRVPLALGRGPGTVRLRPSRAPWSANEVTVPGRVVLDGIQLLRSSFVKMESWGLDAVAKAVLGEGKTMHGGDRAGEILDTFQHDRERFVAYNLTDARLVLEILDRLRVVELAVERSRLTGLPIDRVAGSIAAFDYLYLGALHRRRIVAPSVGAFEDADDEGEEVNLGGHVLEPEPGHYRNVLVLDFKSLYPSLIRTFQIDPLGYLPPAAAERAEDPILAPNGAAFRRRPGILPGLLDELFPRREAAKQAGDGIASHAIKILMNSFYGVLGSTACRFARPQIAGAITAFGRDVLLWSKERIEGCGRRVLYGDTDSLFVLADEADSAAAVRLGKRLVEDLNRDLAAHLEATWRVESRLELELERLFSHLFLPAMRHRAGGARKRYVGRVGDGADAELVFIGMEVVRSDWTELAKDVQRELYRRLFAGEPVESYLAGIVAELRDGRHDERLVYKKGLRKDLAQYTATTPPHVAAARKQSGRVRRTIVYVMTRAGAEPAAERRHPIDHEHYVQKQVRPVAEPVLWALGLDFDKVVGDDAQLELF